MSMFECFFRDFSGYHQTSLIHLRHRILCASGAQLCRLFQVKLLMVELELDLSSLKRVIP